MKNKQLETLLYLKEEIESIINMGSYTTLKEALINNHQINTPKINELFNLLGEIDDGSVKENLDSIKSDIDDVNLSREEYILEIDQLLNQINSIIDEAKSPYATLKEAIDNTNTNVSIETTDNSISLTAKRQSEIEESTFYLRSGETKQVQKIEPNNKMTHYLVEHNLGEKQFNFIIDHFKSLDKNHNLDENMYISSNKTYFGNDMNHLNTDIINTFYENNFYFYETKDYIVSADGELSGTDIKNFMTGIYPSTMNVDCNELYILFKHEYYMDAEIWISDSEFMTHAKVLYKQMPQYEFKPFLPTNTNGNVNYEKKENLKIRFMRFEFSGNDYNLRMNFKILNIPEISYVDTRNKVITLNEIRNLKNIDATGHESKFILDINNTDYSFINKEYQLSQYDFLIDDYIRQNHLNNNDYMYLKDNFNQYDKNVFLNNYIIQERQNGNMKYDQNLLEGEKLFHTENNNPYSGDYTSLYDFDLYITAEGTSRGMNVNYFRNQRYNYTFGNKNFAFDFYVQRVNDNTFAFKIDVDEDNSTMKVEDIDNMYFRMHFDDDPNGTWGGDGYDPYEGDTRINDTTLYFDENKLRQGGVNLPTIDQYDAINYLYTYNPGDYHNGSHRYNQYEMIAFDKHLKCKDRNEQDLLYNVSEYYAQDYYSRAEFNFFTDFTTHDNEYHFQFPLYFVVKMSQTRYESYFADEVEDIMIQIQKGNLFKYNLNLDENCFVHKHFKNKVRSKTLNNNLLQALRIKEVDTTGDFVRFSLSNLTDDFKIYNVNTGQMEVISDIYSSGMTKEELKSIPENIINNMSSITIKYIELENSEFNDITFETIGDRLIEINSENDYFDFGFTTRSLQNNIEEYYKQIERLDDFNPEKNVKLKLLMDNAYKHRGYYIEDPHLDTFEGQYLETPTIDELTKIRIRDFKHYYEFENLTDQDKVIKLYQNRHYNLNLIDQQSGNEISTILDNANALTNDELFKDKIINTLTADMRATLLEAVMAEVDTVNQSYAKEFTTKYFFDAAASKVYTLPISSQDIMLRVEKFITDNTINFDNRMIDVNVENYVSSNIQLVNSYYSNEVKYEEVEFLELPNFFGYTTKEIVVPDHIKNIKKITEKEV